MQTIGIRSPNFDCRGFFHSNLISTYFFLTTLVCQPYFFNKRILTIIYSNSPPLTRISAVAVANDGIENDNDKENSVPGWARNGFVAKKTGNVTKIWNNEVKIIVLFRVFFLN